MFNSGYLFNQQLSKMNFLFWTDYSSCTTRLWQKNNLGGILFYKHLFVTIYVYYWVWLQFLSMMW